MLLKTAKLFLSLESWAYRTLLKVRVVEQKVKLKLAPKPEERATTPVLQVYTPSPTQTLGGLSGLLLSRTPPKSKTVDVSESLVIDTGEVDKEEEQWVFNLNIFRFFVMF